MPSAPQHHHGRVDRGHVAQDDAAGTRRGRRRRGGASRAPVRRRRRVKSNGARRAMPQRSARGSDEALDAGRTRERRPEPEQRAHVLPPWGAAASPRRPPRASDRSGDAPERGVLRHPGRSLGRSHVDDEGSIGDGRRPARCADLNQRPVVARGPSPPRARRPPRGRGRRPRGDGPDRWRAGRRRRRPLVVAGGRRANHIRSAPATAAVQLHGATTFGEIRARIGTWLGREPRSRLGLRRGLRLRRVPGGRYPIADDLAGACGGRPGDAAGLQRPCGAVQPRALTALGVTSSTTQVPYGWFEHDDAGELTGYLHDATPRRPLSRAGLAALKELVPVFTTTSGTPACAPVSTWRRRTASRRSSSRRTPSTTWRCSPGRARGRCARA